MMSAFFKCTSKHNFLARTPRTIGILNRKILESYAKKKVFLLEPKMLINRKCFLFIKMYIFEALKEGSSGNLVRQHHLPHVLQVKPRIQMCSYL